MQTQLALVDGETAVLEKVPLRILSSSTVNALVSQYDAKGIRLTLRGEGQVALEIDSGAFTIEPNTLYRVRGEKGTQIKSSNTATLQFPVQLAEKQMELEINTIRNGQ